MKLNYLIVVSLFVGMLFTSCTKNYDSATVEMNCTGVYVIMNDKTYSVCNGEILADHSSGDEVDIKFTTLSECPTQYDDVVCFMAFNFDGIVEIVKVK